MSGDTFLEALPLRVLLFHFIDNVIESIEIHPVLDLALVFVLKEVDKQSRYCKALVLLSYAFVDPIKVFR